MADDLRGLAARDAAAVPGTLTKAGRDAYEGVALLAAMADHGIRVQDRTFEAAVRAVVAEYDRRGAELELLRRERAGYDLDARTVAAVPALLAMCTEAEETATAATAVDGLDRTPAWLTTPEVRNAIAVAAPGGLTAELERLRARVAELEDGPLIYGVLVPDGRVLAISESPGHVAEGYTQMQARRGPWEVSS